MAKPTKLPKVSKDHYARASFLFQAAVFYAEQGNVPMARMMARNVDLVAKKTVIRALPCLKRRICKKCSTVLLPGLTLSMQVENMLASGSEKADVLTHTCLGCNTTKRFPIGKDRNYKLHSEKNLVEQS